MLYSGKVDQLGGTKVTNIRISDIGLLRALLHATGHKTLQALGTEDLVALSELSWADDSEAEAYPDHWVTIRDLEGLQYCPRLRTVALAGNDIDDIGPLASCPLLERLNLAGNLVSDLTPLANLRALRHLDLSDNKVADLSALSELPLESLNLGSNVTLRDLAPLAAVQGLTELYLDWMPVPDCTPLVELPALRIVHLRTPRSWHEATPSALAALRDRGVVVRTSGALDAMINKTVAERRVGPVSSDRVARSLAEAGLDGLAGLWRLHGPSYRPYGSSMLLLLVDAMYQDSKGKLEDARTADLVRAFVAAGVDPFLPGKHGDTALGASSSV